MSKDLGDIYQGVFNESYGLRVDRVPIKGGLQAPQDAKNTLSPAGSKIGIDPGSLYNQSVSSGNNPYEQEEGQSIDKAELFSIIDNLSKDLDNSKITDRTALMILGKLKNSIK